MVRKLENVDQIIERRKKDWQHRTQEFWAKPYNWPTPPFGHVFLAQAIQDVGKHRFGSAWTEDEPVAWSRNEKTDAAARFRDVINEIARRWEAGGFILKCWPKNGGPAESVPPQWLFLSIDGQKDPLKPSTVVASCWIKQPVERTPPPGSRRLGGELFWLGIEQASLMVLLNAALSVETNPVSPATPPAIIPGGKISAETAFKKWFSEQVAASPNQRSKSRDAFKKEAMTKLPGLSGASFLQVWSEVTREYPDWRKSGPLKKTGPTG